MDFLHTWIVPGTATVSTPAYIAVALVALLLTAVSKGGFGGGVGIMSVPLMLQVAPVDIVIGLWLPVLIACDVATISNYPREWKLSAISKLAPGMLVGIGLTAYLLKHVLAVSTPEFKTVCAAWLNLGIAAISILFVGLNTVKGTERSVAWTPTWRVGLPVGLAGGVTTTIAHAAGSIVTMYLLPQKMDKRVFVGTTGRFYFFFNSVKVPFLVWAGAITVETLRYGLWLMLLAPLGVWLGSWLNKRVSATWFVRLVYLFLLVAACKLLYDGLKVVVP